MSLLPAPLKDMLARSRLTPEVAYFTARELKAEAEAEAGAGAGAGVGKAAPLITTAAPAAATGSA